jgi:NAD(P)-dependent dehydrogenase (short-subunit alcohol dehydrogenase family)
VSVEADVQALVATAEQTWGGVDVLVNDASASSPDVTVAPPSGAADGASGRLTGLF